MKKYLFLGLLLSSIFAFAQCNIPSGMYNLHPLAKKYGVGQFEELQNGLKILDNRSKIINLKTKDQFYLQPIKENMQPLLSFVQNEYLKPLNASEIKPVCGYLLSDSKQDTIMLIELDMSQVALISDEQLGEVRRIFLADFPTEVEKPKRWTRQDLQKFRYFYVWAFSIPSVTGGAIFIPLEHTKSKL